MKYEGSYTYQVSSRGLTVPTTYREDVVTVTTSVTQLVRVNPRRFSLLISNQTPYPVRLAFSPTYLMAGGFILGGDGSTFILTVGEDGELVSSAVYAYSPTGTPVTLYVVEVYGLEKEE